jgi:hypothetical protein
MTKAEGAMGGPEFGVSCSTFRKTIVPSLGSHHWCPILETTGRYASLVQVREPYVVLSFRCEEMLVGRH